MATFYSPKVVTDGLICYLDAANKKSYPGSGSTWFDLCGKYNGTLINSPSFTSDYGGAMNTVAATPSYAQITTLDLSSGAYTIIAASRYNVGGTHGRIVSSINNNWLLGHWAAYTDDYYANGWVSYNVSDTSSNWFIYAGTGDTVTDNWKFYINSKKRDDNNGGGAGPSGIQIGGYAGPYEHTDGQCAFFIAYNRVLTDSEILQNYNTLKGRFTGTYGIV